MDSHRTYPRRKHVPWRQLGSEALVVDVKSGLLYPLNSVAARIWQLSDGQRSMENIVESIAAEFDADEQTIRQDAAAFLGELSQQQLISLENEPQPSPGD